jgi:hypothetical protein
VKKRFSEEQIIGSENRDFFMTPSLSGEPSSPSISWHSNRQAGQHDVYVAARLIANQ